VWRSPAAISANACLFQSLLKFCSPQPAISVCATAIALAMERTMPVLNKCTNELRMVRMMPLVSPLIGVIVGPGASEAGGPLLSKVCHESTPWQGPACDAEGDR
jgi:hypothetical protein